MSGSIQAWESCLQVASLSDVGMRRTNNQDNFSVSLASSLDQWQRRGHLFIVADGMGAHAAGELASKIAVDQIPHLYSKYAELSAPEAIKKAVIGANTEIHRRGQANDDFHNMGTTCSVLVLLPQGAVVAHIGDSRVYRLRGQTLEQLTFDHSLVWEMHQSGQLTEAEMDSGKIPKNVITRSLGPYPEIKVDVEGPFPIEVGDTFLLCSDGLTGVVKDEEIASVLANLPPDEAVRVLVDLANLRGGPDNITAIVAKVTGPELASSAAAEPILLGGNGGKPSGINPITWVVLLAAGLGTVTFFLMTNSWLISLIPALVFLGGLIWLLIQALGSGGGSPLYAGRRFGKGPYVSVKCGTGQAVANQLQEVADQLLTAGRSQGWNIDWDQLAAMMEKAKHMIADENYNEAIRIYGRAISTLMEQLRNQEGSSSSIDLGM